MLGLVRQTCKLPRAHCAAPRVPPVCISRSLPSKRTIIPSTSVSFRRTVTCLAAAEEDASSFAEQARTSAVPSDDTALSGDGNEVDQDEQDLLDDLAIVNSTSVGSILQYAIDLSKAAGTYEVHSWMLVLGILRKENCNAAVLLKQLGLEDLYGAWHEVLWALYVSDGLEAKSYKPEVQLSVRTQNILCGAVNAAKLQGRDKVESQDLLLLLAGTGVLEGLFPDLDLQADTVRAAIEDFVGYRYVIPGDVPDDTPPVKEEDLLIS